MVLDEGNQNSVIYIIYDHLIQMVTSVNHAEQERFAFDNVLNEIFLSVSMTVVNFARGRKYYGECMQTSEKSCVVPANREAAPDTATNKRIWMPPFKVKITFF